VRGVGSSEEDGVNEDVIAGQNRRNIKKRCRLCRGSGGRSRRVIKERTILNKGNIMRDTNATR